MTLRRKLLAAFAGLVAVALLVAGAALFATLRWQATAADMETHYQRSLLLQRVRAGTFQALKEVDDALTSDHVDARADFERALAPTTRDFEQWASLADTQAEQGEVALVREAHQRLISHARQVFARLPQDRAAAIRLADDEVDTGDYERFRVLTEQAVSADRSRRRTLRAETERVRTTTQIMLGVSALSILSLALLIGAYLSHDLFAPLRDLARTAHRLSLGDFKARVDSDRDDEIGEVALALNQLAASIEQRWAAESGGDGGGGEKPSQAGLHRLAAGLQASIAGLRGRPETCDDEALAEMERLVQAVSRLAEAGFPLDLDLEPIDLSVFVHSVIARHRVELAARAVDLELSLAADLEPVLGDRLKLREAIGAAVRNALDALPPKGGRLGFRTYGGDGLVRIEVGDSGRGMEGDLIERALGTDAAADGDGGSGGLALARLIAERHGGGLALFSEPGKGTVAQFTLPHRR
jgi:two-component system, OmpR family, sensor kinase